MFSISDRVSYRKAEGEINGIEQLMNNSRLEQLIDVSMRYADLL